MLLDPRLDANERFRERRRRAQRRRRFRRFTLLAVLALVAAGLTLGTRPFAGPDSAQQTAARSEPAQSPPPPSRSVATGLERRAVPLEIRGVHVAMPMASLEGQLASFVRMRKFGLNTIELDVKDENGEIAFGTPTVPMTRRIGAAESYYDPVAVARRAERSGLYLIGRVVVFEDPVLARRRPGMAIRTRAGGVWRSGSGLGWTNPYDRRVWKYNVDVAEAAVRAGFDEIMFDYVRFPTDGNV